MSIGFHLYNLTIFLVTISCRVIKIENSNSLVKVIQVFNFKQMLFSIITSNNTQILLHLFTRFYFTRCFSIVKFLVRMNLLSK